MSNSVGAVSSKSSPVVKDLGTPTKGNVGCVIFPVVLLPNWGDDTKPLTTKDDAALATRSRQVAVLLPMLNITIGYRQMNPPLFLLLQLSFQYTGSFSSVDRRHR
mmetsp:Transcript_12883/g.23338  ORF Transcript_12883/g.23338 Transcript_12883/m.23338 type:complete len:105 (-) Transcript_12883:148-462(-)